MGPISSSPSLNVATQVRFWLRCLKTFLPNAYTEQEASRIPLAFFTLSALDVLNSLDTHTTPAERAEWADFLYSCQHPGGGFRAFTGSKYGDRPTTAENARWDPANIAGTYFAIVSLIILGDDLKRVQRQKTLEWIGRLQHPDGSFGELLAGNGSVDGGQDVRFCFLAALICRILDSGDVQDAFGPYIDQEDLAKFVLTSKAYDGGMARKPYCESHAGWTYCGVSTLSLLGKLPLLNIESKYPKSAGIVASRDDAEDLIHWLVWRQTSMLSDYRGFYGLEDIDSESDLEDEEVGSSARTESGFTVLGSKPALPPETLDFESLSLTSSADILAGFNGRCNKPADTCYSFWAGSALAILGRSSLINITANRRYLLEKTQHPIGGFGKFPGDLPDILHSYMALASLSIMGEPGLKPLDPLLCTSLTTKERLEKAPWRKSSEEEEES